MLCTGDAHEKVMNFRYHHSKSSFINKTTKNHYSTSIVPLYNVFGMHTGFILFHKSWSCELAVKVDLHIIFVCFLVVFVVVLVFRITTLFFSVV